MDAIEKATKKRRHPRKCGCGARKDEAGNCTARPAPCIPRPHARLQSELRKINERARRNRISASSV